MGSITEAGVQIFRMPEQFGYCAIVETMADIQKVIAQEWSSLILDFKDTVLVDSSGLGVLVFVSQELKAKGRGLLLKGLRPNMYDLLIETGIDRLFDVERPTGIKRAESDFGELDVQLEVHEETEGDVGILSFSGEMNYPSGSMQFKKKIFLSLAKNRKVLLDFYELAFFDSLSVGSILRVSRLLRENGGSMRICAANLVIENMFISLGIDSVIPLFKSREAALKDWNVHG